MVGREETMAWHDDINGFEFILVLVVLAIVVSILESLGVPVLGTLGEAFAVIFGPVGELISKIGVLF